MGISAGEHRSCRYLQRWQGISGRKIVRRDFSGVFPERAARPKRGSQLPHSFGVSSRASASNVSFLGQHLGPGLSLHDVQDACHEVARGKGRDR